MDMQDKYTENSRLFALAESTARLCRCTGTGKAKSIEIQINSALRTIKNVYLTIDRRFGTSSSVPAACEWLLDNYYLAAREGKNASAALREIGSLRTCDDGIILMELCSSLVGAVNGEITEEDCRIYLSGFQSIGALPRRELYAFPAAIRAALIVHISELCSALLKTNTPEDLADDFAAAFTSLRLISGLDLQELLSSVDLTEQLLMSDPSGVYPAMDDAGRAYYRERLTELAKANSMDEHHFARHLLKLCRQAQGEKQHIGYFLFTSPLGKKKKERTGALYIAANILLTLFLSILCGFLSRSVVAALLLVLPLSELTKSLLDYIILLCVPPRRIPRLELKDGVGDDGRSICVISALLSSADSANEYAQKLERVYLCSRDCGRNLMYGILADLPEADTAVTDKDEEIIARAAQAIEELGRKYERDFFLFTRQRKLDEGRGKYSGFERKRGAVFALSALLCGEKSELIVSAGDFEKLNGTKFIITLDSDTDPTPGSLRELIGAMLHPLNRAVLDRENGIVKSGYGIIHPRMDYSISSVGATDFSRIFAGIGGTEPYSMLSGELYMDLYSSGGFSGKGIIDAEALYVCTRAHIPDGCVLSHDALEGAYLHGGYMSDTEFADSFPSSPVSYYRRSHRWIRGDWQNSPWLFKNRIASDVERWKLFDSLRRSLVAPLTFIAIFLGLCLMTNGLRLAAWAALLALASRLLIAITEVGTLRTADLSLRFHSRLFKGSCAAFTQTFIRLWFLPYEAWISASAAVTALWRMLVSGKNLLEWETAAQSELKKRSFINYYRNMWAAPLAGIALILLNMEPLAVSVGIMWIFAPLAALALACPAKQDKEVSDDERHYLTECAAEIWSYFEKYCAKQDNYLPPDNYQEQPPVGIAHRTSPTNIGLALCSALCAVDLNIAGDQAFTIVENMLHTIEQLSKWNGHLYNWYDTRTLRPLEPKYVSSVDCGNLYASLVCLKNGLIDHGKNELAERVDMLMQAMDFSLFYDKGRRLMRIGIAPERGTEAQGLYDLMASEARLSSYIAVAKGDVPREHWRRLSRAMLSAGGYQGMASWSGTMFEYLMPELFLPLKKDSLIYETQKYCLYVQRRRQAQGVWGISESAFFSLDPSLSYRYKAHGCPGLALKRGQQNDLVISPYSSFLALAVEPDAAVKNLRKLEKIGAKGRHGFIEAIDFTPTRSRSAEGEKVRCYMAHHLGMSMLAAANRLQDKIVVRRFMAQPEMSAYSSLLEERLPVSSAVLKLPESQEAKPTRISNELWSRRGEQICFTRPQCSVLSNGVYSVMLTESGISSAACGDMLIYKPPFRQLGDGHGIELMLEYDGEAFPLLPDANEKYPVLWEMDELCCSWSSLLNKCGVKVSAAVAGGDNGEIRRIDISASADIQSARLTLAFEPALADFNDYVNHPAYWRLGLDAHYDGNTLMLHRLERGRQSEAWLCLACDQSFTASADRFCAQGQLSAPLVNAAIEFSLREGESFSARFALCTAFSADEAYAGAQRMLAIGPSEYGAMVSACASLTGMNTREISAAMELISPLWFRRTNAHAVAKNKLWQYSLSGDLPIILCPSNVTEREQIESLTRKFCLLRCCGVYADLVFISDSDGEYRRPVYSHVRDTLAAHGLESLMGCHGGVHLLPVAAEEIIRKSSAVIIGENDSSPRVFEPLSLPVSKPRGKAVPEHHYDDEGSFVFYVNHELPPKVWANTITNGSFSFLAADCGCGNMWLKNAREMRVNRWINDPFAAIGTETLEYINGNDRHSVFAASDGIPCRVRYGLGYSVWEKSFGQTGVRCSAFIPCGYDVRIFIIEMCGNVTGRLAWKLELQLSGSEDDYTSIDVSYVNSIFKARNCRSPFPQSDFKAVFSSAPTAHSTDLFSWYAGKNLKEGENISYPVFAAEFEAKSVLVIACGFEDDDKLLQLCKPNMAFDTFNNTERIWQNNMQRLSVKAPDKAMSAYMSGWAAYQTLACRIMARGSVYQSGGAIGFRDQLQDAVNIILISPEPAKQQILTSCAHQYAEGDVMHWWHSLPDGDKGVRTRCSDDLLWLVWALCEYVEKTGDTEICGESVNYISSKPLAHSERDRYETPLRSPCCESVLMHAKRAIDCCLSRGRGMHGLLMFGSGDWNDGMDKLGGESVWLSWFFAHTVRRFSDLLIKLCKPDSDEYRAIASEIGKASDKAWDGEWYLRGYWPDGAPLGSKKSECCRIDSIAQSWAAMCLDAQNSKIDSALDSAVSMLYDRQTGIVKLFDPPFSGGERDPGYIRTYGAGFRENGGQYTHAAIWLAMACLRRGRQKDGYDILRSLLPENHDLRIYAAEPFVLPADVYSNAEHMGEAGWTWYTGSSGWYFRVVYEDLLGLKLHSGALYIRPSLPDADLSFSIKLKTAGGKTHTIELSDGEILLNGEKYDGKGIPYI